MDPASTDLGPPVAANSPRSATTQRSTTVSVDFAHGVRLGLTFEWAPDPANGGGLLEITDVTAGTAAAGAAAPGDALVGADAHDLSGHRTFDAAVSALRAALALAPAGGGPHVLSFARGGSAAATQSPQRKPSARRPKGGGATSPAAAASSRASSAAASDSGGPAAATNRRASKASKPPPAAQPSAAAELLASIAARRQEEEDADRDAEQALVAARQRRVVHPLQTRLARCLRGDAVLNALSVTVTNESYWYRSRAALGAARHQYRDATYDDKTKVWTAWIYRLEPRPEDLKVVPMRTAVGTAASESKAAVAADRAAKARDCNPGEALAEKHMEPADILATHFSVSVVSECFKRQSAVDRAALVFDAVADEFHRYPTDPRPAPPPTVGPDDPHVATRPAPGAFRKFGTLGPQSQRLQFHRHLGAFGASLALDCRTPAQWKPDQYGASESERYGAARSGAPSAAVATSAAYKASGVRAAPGALQRMMDEALPGAEPLMGSSGKSGGVYAHFFHSLPADMRSAILLDCEKESSGVAASGRRQRKALGLGGDDGPKKGAAAASALYGNDAARDQSVVMKRKNAEAIAAYLVAVRRAHAAAGRLQRVYRARLLPRAVRRSNRAQRAAVDVQRLVRGHYGRLFASLYRRITRVAAVKIQTTYRGLLTLRRVRAYRALLISAASAIQPQVRRWLAQCYVSWLRENYAAALAIQRVVRGFLARAVRKLLALSLAVRLAAPAALKIESLARGAAARRAYTRKVTAHLHEAVVIPAAKLMQRCYRGRLGFLIAKQKRHERDAAREIQRHIRGFLKRAWLAWVMLKRLEERCAVDIGRVARGFMDREIVRRRRYKAYHINVEVPSAILVQCRFRGHSVRSKNDERRRRWYSSLKIQNLYRAVLARRAVLRRWEEMQHALRSAAVLKLQRLVRGAADRVVYYLKRTEVVGKRMYAARVILRAWLRRRDGKRFAALKEAWEVEQSMNVIMEVAEERAEIESDIADVLADIKDQERMRKRAKDRIRTLRSFREETSLRMPKVEAQLEELTNEDLESGWAESFENEWERLSNQLVMCNEELRLQRVNSRRCDQEITKLQFEVEDLEADLDDNGIVEVEEFELLRRMELERAHRRATEDKARRVRMEKCKWAIDDVRLTVVTAGRTDVADREKQAREKHEKGVAQSVTWAKREEAEAAIKADVRQLEKDAAKKKRLELQPYKEGTPALRNTYDAIVSGCADLLRTFSLEQRRPKTDIRANNGAGPDGGEGGGEEVFAQDGEVQGAPSWYDD